MSEDDVIVVGRDSAVNVACICEAHWESDFLFVHLAGGGFLKLSGAPASVLWRAFAGVDRECDRAAAER